MQQILISETLSDSKRKDSIKNLSKNLFMILKLTLHSFVEKRLIFVTVTLPLTVFQLVHTKNLVK